MVVGEEHQRLHQLCQGPTVLARLQQSLDVLLGDEPGPVRQQLVDLIEIPEFRGGTVQPLQPRGVPPHLQELRHVQAHQVGALVPSCCLWGEPGSQHRGAPTLL